MEDEIKKTLEKIRPMLQMDGGDVEYVEIAGDTLKVRLKGACHGCPMSQMTLQHAIEKTIKKDFPSINKVVAVD
jgi:Fe-S cluster biogenesis protein NfuA